MRRLSWCTGILACLFCLLFLSTSWAVETVPSTSVGQQDVPFLLPPPLKIALFIVSIDEKDLGAADPRGTDMTNMRRLEVRLFEGHFREGEKFDIIFKSRQLNDIEFLILRDQDLPATLIQDFRGFPSGLDTITAEVHDKAGHVLASASATLSVIHR